MLHNNLKTQFQAKEQELFQIHLQHNAHSRNLFQQVLRKNNLIIKNCLQRFNQLYNRFEEYDSNFTHLNQQIGKINEINNNFHFQFRRTYLESQKKQTHLSNDILMLKNALKIPAKDTPTEVYLQSDFFKSRINKISQRKRENGEQSQHLLHSNTNSSAFYQSSVKENSISIDQVENLGNKLMQTESSKTNQKTNRIKKFKQKQARLTQRQDKLKYEKQIETLMNNSVRKDQLDCRLTDIKKTLQQKIDEVAQTDRKVCQHNNYDFSQIQQYIDQRIKLSVSQKVTKDYLQTSLLNLKQAWEIEEKTIFEQLQMKASIHLLQQIQKQIKQLRQQINKNKRNQYNHSFNKSCNLPSQNTSPRATFKQDNSSDCRNQYARQNVDEIKTSFKKNLIFSNSLSIIKGPQRKKQKYATVDNFNIQHPSISDKAWKERVIQVLGEGQSIKRSKIKI